MPAATASAIAPNPHFAGRGVGEEFDILHAVPQFVEDGDAAFEQGSAVDRRLGTMTVAFKQAHAEHMFEIGNDLGYDGLGNREMLRRLRHTLALHHGQQDMEITQLYAATDAFRPLHRHLASLAESISYAPKSEMVS
jgi:hypothetical protein